MNYPYLESEYRKIIEKYYPLTEDDSNDDFDNDTNELLFLIEDKENYDLEELKLKIIGDLAYMFRIQRDKERFHERIKNMDIPVFPKTNYGKNE